MSIEHTETGPRQLPFHVDSFEWDHFERFCAAYFVAGTSLPNLNLAGEGAARLRIVDAVRYGTAGSKQRGIDILATMENRATWVLQCKRMPHFTKSDAEKAVAAAETTFSGHTPARYLLWVSGTVATGAQDVIGSHPNWTLWSGERLSMEFVLHTPRKQAFQIITQIFGPGWAKAFFPLPDGLLLNTSEFFSRWDEEGKLFHHQAKFVGRKEVFEKLTKFASGGRGRKALILSAPGGIGKTRLLRAVAEQIEEIAPSRIVRFINPDRPADDEFPRDEEASQMTVFHDDAHRMDTPGLLLTILLRKVADGSRLILATRPGAEDALCERLMNAGYASTDIDRLALKRLTKAEMVELAASRLGEMDATVARSLAELSEGCALVTVVGAELLCRGDLTHLDLNQSAHFRNEVFLRFEGQELDRVRGSLEHSMMVKLARAIAMLSPWNHSDQQNAVVMSEYLGIQRGQVDDACERLLIAGLAVRTHEGLRLTPDLFSDHLVYSACYDETGKVRDSVSPFLDKFQESHSQAILNNLAGAEWRAMQQHGEGTSSVVAPIWRRFLETFESGTFWDRSQMIEKWSAYAVYQPDRSVELANWAMDLTTAPSKCGYAEFDTHEQALRWVPHLLKGVAIWSDANRRSALDALWRLRRDFPMGMAMTSQDRFADFAPIASFSHDNPSTLAGLQDWLDQLIEGKDGPLMCDEPCAFLDVVLRPFFAQVIRRTFNQDKRTFVFSTTPVPIAKTRAVRNRALSLITDQVVPRGTVAAINVLPALAEAYRQTDAFHDLPEKTASEWNAERFHALSLLAKLAKTHQHPLIHFCIRNQLRWQIVYGKDEVHRQACLSVINAMPDTFELRLARFTLSWSHDDLFEQPSEGQTNEWHERYKTQWQSLSQGIARDLIEAHSTALDAHDFLCEWRSLCARHGMTAQIGELLNEIAHQNQSLALEMLNIILESTGSELAGNAANLIYTEGLEFQTVIEGLVLRALESEQTVVVRSFLNSIQFNGSLQSENIKSFVLRLASKAEGAVLESVFSMIRFPFQGVWTDDLLLTLLSRTVSDEQAQCLANVVCNKLRCAGDGDDERVVCKLLNRLAEVRRFNTAGNEAGFIYEMGRRWPRQTLNMYLKRIEAQEQDRASGGNDFEAFPNTLGSLLGGVEDDADFESLARSILDTMMQRKHVDRDPWRRLFVMTVSRKTQLVEQLLIEWLPGAKSIDDLAGIASLTGFDGSRIVYLCPRLVEAVLVRARAFGIQGCERVTCILISGTGPKFRSYSGGQLETGYRYLREEAEKAVRLHESNPILRPFYQKIVEMEVNDANRQRQLQDSLMSDDW